MIATASVRSAEGSLADAQVPEPRLTLRFITRGTEMTLVRMWPFQDLMAARQDVDYSVHLLGRYQGEHSFINPFLGVAGSARSGSLGAGTACGSCSQRIRPAHTASP